MLYVISVSFCVGLFRLGISVYECCWYDMIANDMRYIHPLITGTVYYKYTRVSWLGHPTATNARQNENHVHNSRDAPLTLYPSHGGGCYVIKPIRSYVYTSCRIGSRSLVIYVIWIKYPRHKISVITCVTSLAFYWTPRLAESIIHINVVSVSFCVGLFRLGISVYECCWCGNIVNGMRCIHSQPW